MIPIIDAAIIYARRGWPVFPTRPDKTPATPHGVLDASADPSIVAAWDEAFSRGGVGIACGLDSRLFVIDCDRKNGLDGVEALGEVGELPADTPLVKTPSGGQHGYLTWPADHPPPRNAVGLLPGVDTRSTGGYVVAPTTRGYSWLVGAPDPLTDPGIVIPVAPRWLIDLVNGAGASRRHADPIPERIASGKRNATLTSLAGSMRRRGMDAESIRLALEAVNRERCDPPMTPDEIATIARSVGSYPARAIAGGGDGRPSILVSHDLRAMTAASWAALMASNDPARLFRREGRLIRVVSGGSGSCLAQTVDVDRARFELVETADFYIIAKTPDGEFHRRVAEPPITLCRNLLADPCAPLPRLRRVLQHPVISADGRPIVEPGYDIATGYYLSREGAMSGWRPMSPPVAVDFLRWDLLGDFPFATDLDAAHALALLLLPYARPLVDGPTPMHVVEAPMQGTGKTLLARVCLGHFVTPAIMAQGRDDEEWRKRLTAIIASDAGAVIVDNISGSVTSSPLAAVLTTTTWTDRILGSTETITLPVEQVWCATANNPRMSADIARRSVSIRIDARCERPDTRERWRHAALETWARGRRADIASAAMSLVVAWCRAGRPAHDGIPKGSYESWSAVMGGILRLAGVEGARSIGDASRLRDTADTEGDNLRAWIAAWHTRHEHATITTGAAADLLPEELRAGKDEAAIRRHASYLLRGLRDRVVNGHLVVSAGRGPDNSARWRLEPTPGDTCTGMAARARTDPIWPTGRSLPERDHLPL